MSRITSDKKMKEALSSSDKPDNKVDLFCIKEPFSKYGEDD